MVPAKARKGERASGRLLGLGCYNFIPILSSSLTPKTSSFGSWKKSLKPSAHHLSKEKKRERVSSPTLNTSAEEEINWVIAGLNFVRVWFCRAAVKKG